jgi:hypothetical protein
MSVMRMPRTTILEHLREARRSPAHVYEFQELSRLHESSVAARQRKARPQP